MLACARPSCTPKRRRNQLLYEKRMLYVHLDCFPGCRWLSVSLVLGEMKCFGDAGNRGYRPLAPQIRLFETVCGLDHVWQVSERC